MARDRSVFIVRTGRVSRVGYENPRNPRQGFGYRIYVQAPDRSVDIYAHMDMNSIVVAEGDYVVAGQYLGLYADPPNGTATAAHLHFERRDASGVSINPGEVNPLGPGGQETSRFGPRRHPVTGRLGSHGGKDFIGSEVR